MSNNKNDIDKNEDLLHSNEKSSESIDSQDNSELSSQYDYARNELFKETLSEEKKAFDNEMSYASRYPLNVSIVISAVIICLVQLVSTFDYSSLKTFFSTYNGIKTIAAVFLILIAFTGVFFDVLGFINGIKVLTSKNISLIDTDSIKEKVKNNNPRLKNKDDISKREEIAGQEVNEYIHEQIVNFADLAKQEAKANEERVKSQAKLFQFAGIGSLLLIASYIMLYILL